MEVKLFVTFESKYYHKFHFLCLPWAIHEMAQKIFENFVIYQMAQGALNWASWTPTKQCTPIVIMWLSRAANNKWRHSDGGMKILKTFWAISQWLKVDFWTKEKKFVAPNQWKSDLLTRIM